MSEDTSGGDLTRILCFSRIHPNLKVIGSTLLLEWLEKGQIDLAVFEAMLTDVILKQDKLHWIKSPDFPIHFNRQFHSSRQSCIYRATEQAAKTEHLQYCCRVSKQYERDAHR